MQIDHNFWVLLLFNVTLMLAFSWVTYKILKRSTLYCKVSERALTLSQFTSKVSDILVNRYLIFRRMIKIDTDDDAPHYLLSLQS